MNQKVSDHVHESYRVLTSDGHEITPQEALASFKNGPFSTLLKEEALKQSPSPIKGEPEYLRICKKFGIDWEPMGDVGHMRYGPRAALMFDLLAEQASRTVRTLGLPVFTVKGTNLFRLDEPAIKEHADLFGDRLYTIGDDPENPELVMRYAACHQQFAMIRNWRISYKQLPFGAFEIADSYRLEQSGECMLGFRTRRFFMPDLHIFCRDMEEAQEWFEQIHNRIFAEIREIGLDYGMLINLSSRAAYQQNKGFLSELVSHNRRPGLLHFYPEGTNYYWTVNIEYTIADALGRAREIATIQIDTGNAQRFDINYHDSDGQKKHPVILHTAITGSLERYLYAILDAAVQTSGISALPLWINPEQVRLIPVSEKHVEVANRMADELERVRVRVGVDDRSEPVAGRVREARQDWVGYIAVIGDQEAAGEPLKVYDRGANHDLTISLDAFKRELNLANRRKPFLPLYFPRSLSKRPVGI
jgi:threonyl-tRNA synthetase